MATLASQAVDSCIVVLQQSLKRGRLGLNVTRSLAASTTPVKLGLGSYASSADNHEKNILHHGHRNHSFRNWSRRYNTVVSKSPSARKTKAVIFDLGGVVVPSPQGIFDKFEEKCNLSPGSLVDTIKATGNGGSFAKMERGEYTVEEFCEPFKHEYVSHTGKSISLDQVKEFAYTLCDFTKVVPHKEVLYMFGWLKERGIKVAILTNNFRHNNGKTVFPEELKEVDLVR